MASTSSITPQDSLTYMQLALSLARESPPKPTNFRVGAVLVDESTGEVLATGYTLELPGNTHAEQCSLLKFAAMHDVPEARIGDALPEKTVLYTTMEPCFKRLSGNVPCVDRILSTCSGKNGGIKKVYLGVKEPETFVGKNAGMAKLEDAGIECILVPGLQDEILEVATAGHTKS